MNNLIIAQNYETFGDAGLTSNKVIYYKEDNMVKFRANITDNPFGESQIVTVGEGDTLLKVLQQDPSVTSLTLPLGIKNTKYLLYNNRVIKQLTIPNGYAVVDSYFADYCTSLKEVNLPSNLIGIGNYAFAQCSSLTSITIPNNVSTINENAFQGCANLESVTLSANLNYINNYLFDGCTKLQSIVIPSNVSSIGSYAFRNCTSLTSVTILSNKVTTIYVHAFNNTSISSITIPNSVININNNAFANTNNLVEVNFGNTRTSVPTISAGSFKTATANLKFIVPDDMYDTWKAANIWKTTAYIDKIIKYSDYYNE